MRVQIPPSPPNQLGIFKGYMTTNTEVASLLKELEELSTKPRFGLGKLFTVVDSWLMNNKLDNCNEILNSIDHAKFPEPIILGLATITRSARDKLTNYDKYVVGLRAHLSTKHKPKIVDGLLRGLESDD